MPLPRAVPVTLAAAERTMLKKRARGAKTAHRDRLRAQIVLAAAGAGIAGWHPGAGAGTVGASDAARPSPLSLAKSRGRPLG